MYLGLTSLPIIHNTKKFLLLPVVDSPFYGTKIRTAFWLSRIWGCMQNTYAECMHSLITLLQLGLCSVFKPSFL